MLKKLPLLLAGILCATTGFAQTIVSTSPENRNVVLEEFTGIYCVYCPDGHRIAKSIQDANPDRVALINIHEGSFAVPSGDAPDFRTPWGKAIMNQTGLTGFPSGTINRHIFSGNKTILDRGQWAGAANQILNMPSYVNVGIEAQVDISTGMLTVHVEAYYTGNSPKNNNWLNVALLQNNTKGPQTGGNQGNNYNHVHRLVDLLTGQWGEEITTTTTGSFINRTFQYQIPADYNNIIAQLGDMEVVAFITETRQEIITGKRAIPTLTGQFAGRDAAIRMIAELPQICPGGQNTITPSIAVVNSGTENITSLDIQYKVNGETYTHNWTGTIQPAKTVIINLPAVSHNVQPVNTVEVTIGNDGNNNNNSVSTSFKAVESTGKVTINFTTDNRGSKFRWDIRDSGGNVVFRGGPYANNTTVSEEMQLEEGCYLFRIRDTQKEGSIDVQLVDHHGKIIFNQEGFWGDEVLANFGSTGFLAVGSNELQTLSVYPNPANDMLNISGAEKANIAVFDILGKQLFTRDNIHAQEALNVSQLQAGTYFLKISKDGQTVTKKFVKE